MLGNLSGFEWDIHNVSHIATHGVLPMEVEEAVARKHIVIVATPKDGENRWKLFGTTEAKRHLVVVFTIRNDKFRTITAYTMNQAERRLYAAQIKD